MSDKISKNFLGHSQEIMGKDPEIKKRLEKVMGKVADSIVKKKYVETDHPKKRDPGADNQSS